MHHSYFRSTAAVDSCPFRFLVLKIQQQDYFTRTRPFLKLDVKKKGRTKARPLNMNLSQRREAHLSAGL